MDTFLTIMAVLCVVLGILGSILPVLPGPPISYLGLLLARWGGIEEFDARFLIIWAAVVIVVTVMDYVLPTWFTGRFGGSRYASWGSVAGLVAGIFFFPPWGIVIGPFAGAFIGELVHDSNNVGHALKVAAGSFMAFIAGTGVKLAVTGLMAYYVLRAVIG